MSAWAHPILSCAATREFEARRFGDDDASAWAAMRQAGTAVGRAILRDFQEVGAWSASARVVVLVGKGHNGGDALLAAAELLRTMPAARVSVAFAFGERALRSLAVAAWRTLSETAPERVAILREIGDAGPCDVLIDGVFGFQYRPPVPPAVAMLLTKANALPARLRVAVDLPSGWDGPGAFRADFTYATGIVKSPVFDTPAAGRVRYLDLGFFQQTVDQTEWADGDAVVTDDVLAPLRGLRPSASDKRSYGHLYLVGGSRGFPGAILMSVLAAVRSGTGLVTAGVPESLVPAYLARCPEAMWVGLPETPEGGLALDGRLEVLGGLGRATALVIGPGLGRSPETLMLARELVSAATVPLVIDADALQADIVSLGRACRVLTPHAGELARIAGPMPVRTWARETGHVVVEKGPTTWVHGGGRAYASLTGGPVLARGGSGDLLAGLIGGQLAQTPTDPLGAAVRGAYWHGAAADALARCFGQVAVNTTQLLDFLPVALRDAGA